MKIPSSPQQAAVTIQASSPSSPGSEISGAGALTSAVAHFCKCRVVALAKAAVEIAAASFLSDSLDAANKTVDITKTRHEECVASIKDIRCKNCPAPALP
jgi:hypothetical protein